MYNYTINEKGNRNPVTRKELIKVANELYNNDTFHQEKRLATCSAWYKLVDTADVVLKSYNTIVAFFAHRHGTVYCFDYYSVTTSQHIAKFARLMKADRITYLYHKSDNVIERGIREYTSTYKLNKKERENAERCDYSIYIGCPF